MKNRTLMLGTTLAFGIAALPALVSAQTAPSPTPSPTPPTTMPAPQTAPRTTTTAPAVTTAPATTSDARRASRVIGANVYNEENRSVGEVHDLMISQAGGPVTAVLSVGGFLGIGERYVAVPLGDLRWSSERNRWMLPGATVDSLKARPAFTYPERS
ncbi:PRC-barrel domain containing protein [Roseomonas sp. JC162]|uniref:PRC-barrel domain containing protein n=1 Tax=Neoroseomonas marina TaxID=1232220 RepID=A0A848EDI6_9PROT|nr:PRC-barrel domain-containing protein [Neoroseomonas marina]NMJ41385.1 PRC-barrel domain containing protein [Neoroseomonas marina]